MKILMDLDLNPLLLRHCAHALKTGLACVLSFAVSILSGSPYAIWAVVSAIIAMQGNVAESLHTGLVRLTGMAIGAVVGVGLLFLEYPGPWHIGATLFCITALGTYLSRYGTRYTLATIAATILLLPGLQATSGDHTAALKFGLALILEIGIGVGAALLVSLLVWPVRLVDTLRGDLTRQFSDCAEMLDSIISAYLADQQMLSGTKLRTMSNKTWSNHEQLVKILKNEALLYRYEHKVMEIQVKLINRTLEALRGLIDALNEYDEKSYDPLLGKELRFLTDAIMAALRHMGGVNVKEPAPDLVRALTKGVDAAEKRLMVLRKGPTAGLPLHRVLQLFTVYQTLRQLTEGVLLAIYAAQSVDDQAKAGKKQKKEKI